MPARGALTPEDEDLKAQVLAAIPSGASVPSDLRTDARVLARVSDGIYRQPASALRELIANAYDADASRVVIHTDCPRFKEVTVHDDGRGMSVDALVRLIHHIGGSAKRTHYGDVLGVTDPHDPLRSPGGRRLIGKIGIGLFSVSQLTRRFRIITKQRGNSFRLVASVVLRTYSEDDLARTADETDDGVVTGHVQIQAVAAEDVESQGTDIILEDLSPPARDMLRSRDIWERVSADLEVGEKELSRYAPPSYHIGRLNDDAATFVIPEKLPWEREDPPGVRFRKLHDAIVTEVGRREPKPRLERSLDRYLRTLWTLSLSLPLEYQEGEHPFDLTGAALPRFFMLQNKSRVSAEEISLGPTESLRQRLNLQTPARTPGDRFEVFVDGIKLFRPLVFRSLPNASRDDDARRPLMFVGRWDVPLAMVPEEVVGGRRLYFEAYFLWTPKVIPTDHNGVMIRIADASGTLFDPTFMSYQVAELTRLSQISAEVFVSAGLDAALNIDRESFNFGHPHAKLMMSWIHNALRQLTNTHKRLTKERIERERARKIEAEEDELQRIVHDKTSLVGEEPPPDVHFVDREAEATEAREQGKIVLVRSELLRDVRLPQAAAGSGLRQKLLENRLAAIAQVLESFGVFRAMDYRRQTELMNAIARIFAAEGTDES